jgi:hypothetical protein
VNSMESSSAEVQEAVADDRSIRPVIEHALTVYYDGNAELARTLIDRLLAEAQNR